MAAKIADSMVMRTVVLFYTLSILPGRRSMRALKLFVGHHKKMMKIIIIGLEKNW